MDRGLIDRTSAMPTLLSSWLDGALRLHDTTHTQSFVWIGLKALLGSWRIRDLYLDIDID